MWALIINEKVAELTDIDPKDRFHSDLFFVKCGDDVIAGMDYINGDFLAVSNDRSINDIRSLMKLSSADARKRLAKAGLLLGIIESMNAMADDCEIKIMWEYETVFKRLDPVLVNFCTNIIGLTDLQLDDLFTG